MPVSALVSLSILTRRGILGRGFEGGRADVKKREVRQVGKIPQGGENDTSESGVVLAVSNSSVRTIPSIL
jgi:hypothetical protein